jgi:hypothetical protein
MYAQYRITVLLLFVLSFGPQAMSQQTKKCGDLGISFHGEIRYARTIETGARKGDIERIRLIRPLGPTYGPNSNDWKKIFVELPPNLKLTPSEISIETHYQHARTRRALDLKSGPFSLGEPEQNFYPLAETQFMDLIAEGPSAPGLLRFSIKYKDQILCEHILTIVTGD